MIPRNALLYLAHLRSLPELTDMTIAIDDIIALYGRHFYYYTIDAAALPGLLTGDLKSHTTSPYSGHFTLKGPLSAWLAIVAGGTEGLLRVDCGGLRAVG